MVQSRLTKALAVLNKKMRFHDVKQVGFKEPSRPDTYLSPLLTPPPRSPKTPEDFMHPEKLGHWRSWGWDYTNYKADRFYGHEWIGATVIGMMLCIWVFNYLPDYKLHDWAKREAFLRTHKREALGLPLIDKDYVDPDRIHLPTEEELGDFHVQL